MRRFPAAKQARKAPKPRVVKAHVHTHGYATGRADATNPYDPNAARDQFERLNPSSFDGGAPLTRAQRLERQGTRAGLFGLQKAQFADEMARTLDQQRRGGDSYAARAARVQANTQATRDRYARLVQAEAEAAGGGAPQQAEEVAGEEE